ncbi:hypothetical protein [Floridanema aerugineum]|uniref:Uncharacterized protein n=1 Tax=Floridaenema aerugineum BLCC-F46 TaxID=3153654 RepID=A0ABV4XA18_9CYAN
MAITNKLLRECDQHFDKIWVADGSTLEALFRKLKSLEDKFSHTLSDKKI